MHIQTEIERFLRSTGTPATRFRREAARDPQLIPDMRRGREFGPALVARLVAYMERSR